MNNFLKIIKDIQAPLNEIGRKDFPETVIPIEVSKILSTANAHLEFNQNDLLKEMLDSQINSYYTAGTFSDFNCLLEENEYFRTELYFWDRRDTGIHSHPFLGAFQCLKGSLMAIDYKFSASTVINGSREVSLGELTLTKTQKIMAGDVYPIDQGTNHIHKTIHMEPTINLCIRSRTENSVPNFSFLYPGLRIQKKPLNSQEERWLELYGYLSLRMENEAILQKTFEKFDIPSLINFVINGKKIVAPFMNAEATDVFYKKCKEKINQTPSWNKLSSIIEENEKLNEKLNLAYKI
jgi:hypothetical protein